MIKAQCSHGIIINKYLQWLTVVVGSVKLSVKLFIQYHLCTYKAITFRWLCEWVFSFFFSLLGALVGLCAWQHSHCCLSTQRSGISVRGSSSCLLLPVGSLRHHRHEVTVFCLPVRRRRQRRVAAPGVTAGFHDGGVGVAVQVMADERRFSPASFPPGHLPLSPLPAQCCLGLCIAETENDRHKQSLKVGEDGYKKINGLVVISIWYPGNKDVLDSQQRDEDKGGSHCLHVGCRLSTVCLPQLGD